MTKAVELDRQIFYTHCIVRRNNISICFIKSFMGKPHKGKRPHRRSRCIWEHNNKIHLKQTGWDGWTCLIWLGI